MSGLTDLSVFQEVQSDLDILQFVEAHSAFFPRLEEMEAAVTNSSTRHQMCPVTQSSLLL